MNPNPLCPDSSVWRLSLITLRSDRIIIHLEPARRAVPCPECGAVPKRVHSRYQRTPWDLPWAQWPVQLVVHSRKFFCDNPNCSRRIFAERFPGVLESYARQTTRLRHTLLELSYASSAEAAARVGKLLGYFSSPDTLIRLQRNESFSFPQTDVLGVDEFSLRRGQTFATLLVNLEQHQVIDVLEGREAEPLTHWLQAHPGVAVLARDRSDAYALAGRTGAPHALQVADRFHLMKNVGDALKELVRSRRWNIPAAEPDTTVSIHGRSAPVQKENKHKPSPRKQAIWEAVQQAKESGLSMRAIARELDIHRNTVRKYLDADGPPAYKLLRPRRTNLDPFMDYIQTRWNEGCHNGRQLFVELRERGYRGCYTQVRDAVHSWRPKRVVSPPRPKASTFHWLVLRPYSKLNNSQKQDLQRFLEVNPALAKGHYLKEGFQRLVAQRNVEALDGWIHEAAESGLKPFESLARGFVQDYEAVRLALIMPWSTAQCEGQICRVKLIKRQGYGRAKLDLLRQRILHRGLAA